METPLHPRGPSSGHPKRAERRVKVASKTLKVLRNCDSPQGTGYWELKLLFAATGRFLRAWPDRQKHTARRFGEVLLVLSGIWLVGNSLGHVTIGAHLKHVKKYRRRAGLLGTNIFNYMATAERN